MLDILHTIITGSLVLAFTFLVLIALPKSQLRDFLKPWCFAFLCVLYVLSPIDLAPEIALGPFGLIDDAAAVFAGVSAIRSSFKPRKAA